MLENGDSKVGKDKREVEIRVVAFCDLEEKTEFRLATNLPESGEEGVNNEESGCDPAPSYGARERAPRSGDICTKMANRITLEVFKDALKARQTNDEE